MLLLGWAWRVPCLPHLFLSLTWDLGGHVFQWTYLQGRRKIPKSHQTSCKTGGFYELSHWHQSLPSWDVLKLSQDCLDKCRYKLQFKICPLTVELNTFNCHKQAISYDFFNHMVLFAFFFCAAGNQALGLTHARQVTYHWAIPPSLFLKHPSWGAWLKTKAIISENVLNVN